MNAKLKYFLARIRRYWLMHLALFWCLLLYTLPYATPYIYLAQPQGGQSKSATNLALQKKAKSLSAELKTYQKRQALVLLEAEIRQFNQRAESLTFKHPELVSRYESISQQFGQLLNRTIRIDRIPQLSLPLVEQSSGGNITDEQSASLAAVRLAELRKQLFSAPVPESNWIEKFLPLDFFSKLKIWGMYLVAPALLCFAVLELTALLLIFASDRVVNREQLETLNPSLEIFQFPKQLLSAKKVHRRISHHTRQAAKKQNYLPDSEQKRSGITDLAQFNNLPEVLLPVTNRRLIAEKQQIEKFTAELIFALRHRQCNGLLSTDLLNSKIKVPVILNVAAAFSQLAEKVLIVDANLITPELSPFFSVSADLPGFAECISGKAQLSQCIRETQFSGLSFLPAGFDLRAGKKFLSKSATIDLLEYLFVQYDYVIINTASVENDLAYKFLAKASALKVIITDTQTDRISRINQNLDELKRLQVSADAIILSR